MNIKKESGENRKFNTGAEKQHSEGKGTPVLFPGDAYTEICKHFEDGAKHYEARNWEQGIPLGELINSLERHIADEKMGDTSERHDRAMAWNAIVYLATKIRIQRGLLPKELDDMPRYELVRQRQDREAVRKIAEQAVPLQIEPTIECVPEKGWQIRLANRMFLGTYRDHTKINERVYVEVATPYYYQSKKQAVHYLDCYLETLK